jgi:rubredoxin-NAD+ reductase
MSETWRQYICRACGDIYDEALGDPDSGLAPGTRFADIPDDWECPVCGVTKADFEPYEARAPLNAAEPVATAPRAVGVVIVGAGTAGWSAAEALRTLDPEIPITIVTRCAGDAYNKPELSVALARNATMETLVRETGAAKAARLGVRLLPGTYAIGIDPVRRILRTTRGPLRYTQLVLAQGARPAMPPTLPADLCWRINDLQTWALLHRRIAHSRQRVAIVGAGMVGCELAEDFARSGHDVTLMDVQAQPLGGLLPAPAAIRLSNGLAGLGIRFLGETRIASARREDGGIRIETVDAGIIQADLVIAATGLVTDERLARSAGLAFDRGVLVDGSTLESNVPGIFALGDCISFNGQPCRFVEPIAKQADAIAHGILDRPHRGYDHLQPVIRLKTKSTPIVLHGAPRAGMPWREIESGSHLVMEQWVDGACVSRLAT